MAIVALVWPLLWLVARNSNGADVFACVPIAIVRTAMALYSTVERLCGLASVV